jgi:NTE family protein
VPGERATAGLVLALGGGGARGLAHIGVLEVLAESGLPVRAVVGTSIGAEIGAFLAAGMSVAEMTSVATSLDWKLVLRLFFPDLRAGGLASGERIVSWLADKLGAVRIEDLALPFAAVATDLESGDEVVLDRGPLVEAVRASLSIPGTLAPFRLGGRLLVDGGVVNQVPADVARRLHGGPVLAVAVHAASQAWPGPAPKAAPWRERLAQRLGERWMRRAPRLRERLQAKVAPAEGDDESGWSPLLVLQRSALASQEMLVRLRQEASPPDVLLVPDVGDVGMLEFYEAEEAIEAGRVAARARLEEIAALASRAGS